MGVTACRVCCGPQARQILEREYNNLLALGTDRRLDEVSTAGGRGALTLPPLLPLTLPVFVSVSATTKTSEVRPGGGSSHPETFTV